MAIKYGRPIEGKTRLRPVEAEPAAKLGVKPAADPAAALGPTERPRRNRRAEWARRMVRENVLTTDDLIWPLFIVDGHKARKPVDSMPGVERVSVDEAARGGGRRRALSIP